MQAKVIPYDNKPKSLELLLNAGWKVQAIFVHQSKAILIMIK